MLTMGKTVRFVIAGGLALFCCAAAPAPKKDVKKEQPGKLAEKKDEKATDSGKPKSTVDPFGVTMVNPTKKDGRTWFAKWTAARALKKGQTDPQDSEFQNRGSGTFEVKGGGVAVASGAVNRHYIWDQSAAKKWQNIELTFYGKYGKIAPAAGAPKPPPSGLMIEVRTGDGHVDDPARQCDGASYSLALYDDGRAEFKKEAKHPVYSSKNPSAKVWDGGGAMPEGVWIGFKAVVKDVADGVYLALYRDMTDGAGGGKWDKLLEYTDKGAWTVGDGTPICERPATHVLKGAYPVVLIRNDNATTEYKKVSVREISP